MPGMCPASLCLYAGVISFVLGCCVGSFLNVVIYRLPSGLGINSPRRSFCPLCKHQLTWYENIPVISYIFLRGKCSACQKPISLRYPAVELLTGVLFAGILWTHGLYSAIPYWILVSGLIAATFIDLDHLIIPDSITLGGIVIGVAVSTIHPSIMGSVSHLDGFLWSITGAAAGFLLFFALLQLGKMVFGASTHKFDKDTPFRWVREGDRADIFLGEDTLTWEETFSRASDLVEIEVSQFSIDGERKPDGVIRFTYDTLSFANGDTPQALDHLNHMEGRAAWIRIPREAMGFGDVKFMAAIGAFLGWEATIFILVFACIIGAIFGITSKIINKGASTRIPFGPYLSASAVLWLFAGPDIVSHYLHFLFARG